MTQLTSSVFDLSANLAPKAAPALVAADERHFATVARSLDETVAELSERLEAARRAPARKGRQAVDRDDEVRRLTARLRTLRRFGLDLCLGHMAFAEGDGGEVVYIGRQGLTDSGGGRLLVDWRSPAAEPFFGATHANPMGLVSRRRYRWTRGRITDYWDEVFAADEFDGHRVALDDQSAFIASLGGSRSPRMRDVLGTIQADQDAIIRAGSAGTLVVDGGPGTGKTVVALHRTAYLLYSDPRLGHRRGAVLFVGPHEPYLAYVSDVLPNLGEEDVQTCTLRDLVPEGASAGVEADPAVAALKSQARMVTAVEAAVRFYEEPPTSRIRIGSAVFTADDWAEAFDAPDSGTPHNEARERIWEEILAIVEAKTGERLRHHPELAAELNRSWPILEAADLVGDLWTVPAYLRRCAPWLGAHDVTLLGRPDPTAWTDADLPFLDAARQRLGDPDAARRAREREAAKTANRAHLDRVIEDLVEADDDPEGVMAMLRQQTLREDLDDGHAPESIVRDPLAGPFAHIVVDEAQELTDAQWQMLLLRCPSRSFTIVGDRAQARHGFTGSWQERLTRVGLDRIDIATLTINYRTPEEVMAEAEPVIRAALPDANVPTSIRANGLPVLHAHRADLGRILDEWLAADPDGVACVIGDPAFAATDRVRSLTPELSKGLEFDLVVLVDPDGWGAVDRYVAMTRATQRLVILTTRPCPDGPAGP